MHYFTIIIVAHTTFHSLLNHLTNDFPEANNIFFIISIDSIIGLLLLLLFFNASFFRKSASCTNINNTIHSHWCGDHITVNIQIIWCSSLNTKKCLSKTAIIWKNVHGEFKRGCARASAFYRRTIDYLTDFFPFHTQCIWLQRYFIWHFFFAIAQNAIPSDFGHTWKVFEKETEKKAGRERARETHRQFHDQISIHAKSFQIISSLHATDEWVYWLNIFSSIRYLDFPYLFVHYLRDKNFQLATQWLRTQNTQIFFCRALILDLHTYT